MVLIRDYILAVIILLGLFALIQWAGHHQAAKEHPQTVERLIPLETV